MMVHLSFASGLDLVSTALVSCLYETYARSFIMIYPKCVYFIHAPVDLVSRSLVCFWFLFGYNVQGNGPWGVPTHVGALFISHTMLRPKKPELWMQLWRPRRGLTWRHWLMSDGWLLWCITPPESCHWTLINSIFRTITSDGYQIKFHFFVNMWSSKTSITDYIGCKWGPSRCP